MSDITEFNVQTQQETVRKFTKKEESGINLIKQEFLNSGVVTLTDNSVRDSAIEKLKSLGLTEEQAKSIAGVS